MTKMFAALVAGLLMLWAPLALPNTGLPSVGAAYAADKYAPPYSANTSLPDTAQARVGVQSRVGVLNGSVFQNVTCYIGVIAGTESATVSAGGLDLGDNGFAGGGFLGCQMANGKLVYGLEGDITFSNLSPDLANAVLTDTEYLASLRGRLGYVIGNALLYATAGMAWSDVDITTALAADNELLTGFVYGGGVELAVTDNVFLRLEGLRYDFSGELFNSLGVKADTTRDVFRVGAGWRF